jgi:hypothetical protein
MENKKKNNNNNSNINKGVKMTRWGVFEARNLLDVMSMLPRQSLPSVLLLQLRTEPLSRRTFPLSLAHSKTTLWTSETRSWLVQCVATCGRVNTLTLTLFSKHTENLPRMPKSNQCVSFHQMVTRRHLS